MARAGRWQGRQGRRQGRPHARSSAAIRRLKIAARHARSACSCCSASSSASSTPAPTVPDPDDDPDLPDHGRLLRRRHDRDGPAGQREPHQRDPGAGLEAGAERRAGRREPQLLHRPGHLVHRHRCAARGTTSPAASTQGGSTITQQYVKNAILQDSSADVQPEVQGAVPRGQAGQQLLEGPDPRELPEHHLLRPRRLRHRGGREDLLRRHGRAADRRSRAPCSPC